MPSPSPRILVLLGWSALQQGAVVRFGSKIDYVVDRMRLLFPGQIDVVLRLESLGRPAVSRYGPHAITAVLTLPVIVACALVSASELLDKKGLIPRGAFRHWWFLIRKYFWQHTILRNGYSLVAGQILTDAEIEAANALGVTTMEITHGVFDDTTILSYLKKMPDYHAVWCNQSKTILKDRGLEPIHLPFPPGRQRNPKSGEDNTLLVCLTWGLDTSADGHGAVEPQVWAHLPKVSQRFELLRFRLHPVLPGRSRRAVISFLKSNFPRASISHRGRPLDLDLRESKAVFTDNSSVWLDALLAGVPTVTTSSATFTRAKRFMREFTSAEKGIYLVGEGSLLPENIEKPSPMDEAPDIWEDFDSVIAKHLS